MSIHQQSQQHRDASAVGDAMDYPQSVPDWARRSPEDLLRYVYVCPHPSRELDELLGVAVPPHDRS